MGTFNEENIRSELPLTKGEDDLIAGAETPGGTSQANKTRMFSVIYSVKHMEDAVAKLIASNEALSQSNDRYARAMKWLTVGLLLMAAFQVVGIALPYLAP